MELCWELTDAIDNLEIAVDRKVSAEIDAGACRTKFDYDKAHKRQNEAAVARKALEKAIQAELQNWVTMTEARVRAQVEKELREKLAALV